MAASMVPTILITRKPYLLFRKPNPRRSPICSRGKISVIIASSSSSFRNGSPPETECPVPWDQQPVNEYTALSTSFPFSWAAADLRDYCTRLTLVGSSFAILVGLPVAAFGTGAVANTSADALRCGVGAASAGIISVTFTVLRMYLGWAYVGNRLLSATVECKSGISFVLISSIRLFHNILRRVFVFLFIYFMVDEETGWYDGQVRALG